MITFDVGGPVSHLRFLPDGKRLFVCTDERECTFWSIDGSKRSPITAPRKGGYLRNDAFSGEIVAFHPTKPLGYLARSGCLVAFDTRTAALRADPKVRGDQVVLSPDGSRCLAAVASFGVTPRLTGFVVGSRRAPTNFPVAGMPTVLGGFLPDGERFVTVEGDRIRIRSFATGEYLATGKQKVFGFFHSQVSPDGRFWAGYGYSSFCKFPLDTLGPPERIKSSSADGNFCSFAFHPANKMLAVIHGGPTLVKMYTVDGLKKTAVFNWKVGPLSAVVFSPDCALAAAGGQNGRVVIWDVDE
jgi:WD40 repeat protein